LDIVDPDNFMMNEIFLPNILLHLFPFAVRGISLYYERVTVGKFLAF